MPLGVPVVPLVHRKIPPRPRPAARPGRGAGSSPDSGVIADQRQRLRHLQHPRHVAGRGTRDRAGPPPGPPRGCRPGAGRSRTGPAAGPPPGRREVSRPRPGAWPRPGPNPAVRRRSASRRSAASSRYGASPRQAAASSICSVSAVIFRSDRSSCPPARRAREESRDWRARPWPARPPACGLLRRGRRSGTRRGSKVRQGCCLRPVSGTASGVRASTAVSAMLPK